MQVLLGSDLNCQVGFLPNVVGEVAHAERSKDVRSAEALYFAERWNLKFASSFHYANCSRQ